ncbi:unnamed protein product [Amoebophrya sp. A25]|nr:unnamed protein product [Amoebophrya sp. A25]|eukprot:GSA25T00010591001.1
MSRFGQFIMGPAGSGKSTYAQHMAEYMQVAHRKNCRLVNLDPAVLENNYKKSDAKGGNGSSPGDKDEDQDEEAPNIYDIDIRDLITSDDVQEDLEFGPNGGLLYAMEYFADNLRSWFREELEQFAGDNEYFLFDCPGQIELYIHHPVMRWVVDFLQDECNIRLCGVFLLDASVVANGVCASKFLSGSLMALNCMMHLALPHVNLLSKVDLLEEGQLGKMHNDDEIDEQDGGAAGSTTARAAAERLIMPGIRGGAAEEATSAGGGQERSPPAVLERFLDNEVQDLLPELNRDMHPRFRALNHALVELLDEYKMVCYSCVSKYDEDSLSEIAHRVADLVQYYENQEVDDQAYDRAMERVNERAYEGMGENQEDREDYHSGDEDVERELEESLGNMDLADYGDMSLEKYGLAGA